MEELNAVLTEGLAIATSARSTVSLVVGVWPELVEPFSKGASELVHRYDAWKLRMGAASERLQRLALPPCP
jgi:hypothetical protein